ncbi:MAG: hypothetical protein V4717_15375 [Bacteroidota bacterium]
MKKLLPALLLSLPLFFTACDKDDNPVTPPATENYQPVSAGSTWTYEFRNNAPVSKSTFVVTAKGTDSTINGKTYKVFGSTAGSNEYYNTNGSDYYQFTGIAGITNNTELLYLKTNVAASASWSETKDVTIPGLGAASVKLTYTLVEKMPSMTVEGTAYTNVLHVKVALSDVKIGVIPVAVSSQDVNFYYAPNVGRIRSVVKLTLAPPIGGPIVTDTETVLKVAVIK